MASVRLRLQLLSLAQGPEALDLLRFAAGAAPEAGRVSVWARGMAEDVEAAAADDLVRALVGRRFNEVSVERQAPRKAAATADGLSLKRLGMSLRLAPTHALWADTRPVVSETREAAQRRASCDSLARALRWNEVERYPTLLDARCELRAPAASQVTPAAWQAFFEDALAGVPAHGTGYGDLGPPAPVDVLQQLAPWVRGCEQLDRRFAGWHELLIGPAAVCAGLARVLGVEARELRAGRAGFARALLVVPVERLRARDASIDLAADFFAPRDASTAHRELDSSAGEFRVAGHVYYTAARQAWLDERRVLADAPAGYRYEPLLAETHCRALGVDPSGMLVTLMPSGALDALHGELSARLGAVPAPVNGREAWLACRGAFDSPHAAVLGRDRAEVIQLLGRLSGLEG